jgi:hypothetical protein
MPPFGGKVTTAVLPRQSSKVSAEPLTFRPLLYSPEAGERQRQSRCDTKSRLESPWRVSRLTGSDRHLATNRERLSLVRQERRFCYPLPRLS